MQGGLISSTIMKTSFARKRKKRGQRMEREKWRGKVEKKEKEKKREQETGDLDRLDAMLLRAVGTGGNSYEIHQQGQVFQLVHLLVV